MNKINENVTRTFLKIHSRTRLSTSEDPPTDRALGTHYDSTGKFVRGFVDFPRSMGSPLTVPVKETVNLFLFLLPLPPPLLFLSSCHCPPTPPHSFWFPPVLLGAVRTSDRLPSPCRKEPDVGDDMRSPGPTVGRNLESHTHH